MAPRPDVSEERKAQILDAALVVFAEKGFDSARMDDIVQQSGLSKGGVYWYFKSKDDIIMALMENLFATDLAEFRALLAMEGPVVPMMEQVVAEVSAQFETFGPLMRVGYEFYARAMRDEAMQSVLQGYYEAYGESIAAMLERGVAQGEFHPIADSRAVAFAMIAMMEGAALLWMLEATPGTLAGQIVAGMQLILNGLMAK